MNAGAALSAALVDPSALIAALDDALDATRLERTEDAFVALAPMLDELRAVAEVQRRSWKQTQLTIEAHLTVLDSENDLSSSGVHALGTAPDVVLSGLREELQIRPTERDWAIWIGTLAGPSADSRPSLKAALAGPIAVSGIPCHGDLDEWIADVRTELTALFQTAGVAPPDDVLAFGQAATFRGTVIDSGRDLWKSMASPPSFVARVAVRAVTSEEAIRDAREALRAVYGFSDVGLVHDLRPDVIIWSERSGWHKPSTSARGRSVGEILAARYATRAVAHWADDLGSPLDPARLSLLRSRALVRNTLVAPEVRLMRAFASLEALTPPGQNFDHVAERLWAQTAAGEARSLLLHLANRTLEPSLWTLRSDATTEDRDSRQDALRKSSPRWGLELLDNIDSVLEVIDPEAMEPILSRATRTYLTRPEIRVEARTRHASALKRARRLRNLTAHGQRVADRVLMPTVLFLADQLEWAIAASEDASATSWLGSLAKPPDAGRIGTTLEDLLTG